MNGPGLVKAHYRPRHFALMPGTIGGRTALEMNRSLHKKRLKSIRSVVDVTPPRTFLKKPASFVHTRSRTPSPTKRRPSSAFMSDSLDDDLDTSHSMKERPRSSLGTRKIGKPRERGKQYSPSLNMARFGRGRGDRRRSSILPDDEIEQLFGDRRKGISPSTMDRAHEMRRRRTEKFGFGPEEEGIFEGFVSLLSRYRSPMVDEILDEAFHAADLEALLGEFEGYESHSAAEADLLGSRWQDDETKGVSEERLEDVSGGGRRGKDGDMEGEEEGIL
eukprot:TRINITY_DN1955_c0_g1_i2.p1 TRINITY_DN1955_c0_g1~~TRINITY_DN1955_c0_g1_i2.p1  ORF type:complete len:276 (-),score=76.35 TRINITY_DN1955_c0_g1_i2:470-1297(-)